MCCGIVGSLRPTRRYVTVTTRCVTKVQNTQACIGCHAFQAIGMFNHIIQSTGAILSLMGLDQMFCSYWYNCHKIVHCGAIPTQPPFLFFKISAAFGYSGVAVEKVGAILSRKVSLVAFVLQCRIARARNSPS